MTQRLLFLFVSLFSLLTVANATPRTMQPSYQMSVSPAVPAFDMYASFVSLNVSPTAPAFTQEGSFIIYYNHIMWFFHGQWRQIMSLDTWLGLFSGAQTLDPTNHTYLSAPIGPYLEADNGLINHTATGKVYFREGNLIRHITSVATFNEYFFNWSAVKDVASISNYIIGDPI